MSLKIRLKTATPPFFNVYLWKTLICPIMVRIIKRLDRIYTHTSRILFRTLRRALTVIIFSLGRRDLSWCASNTLKAHLLMTSSFFKGDIIMPNCYNSNHSATLKLSSITRLPSTQLNPSHPSGISNL